MITNHKIIIGIDTGTHTGFAVWSKKHRCFLEIACLKIHEAMDKVLAYYKQHGDDLFVRFEDARLLTWFGGKDSKAIQGAGSIKRDCAIWQDFLEDYKIPFASISPRAGITKLPAEKFAQVTGWKERTNNHARDAAMLVYGY